MSTSLHRQILAGLLLAVVAHYAFAKDENATIAFGSCLRQWQPQPVWSAIANLSPTAFVFLGDNMYSDRGKYEKLKQPERIQQAYRDLDASEAFTRFRQLSEVQKIQWLATWDDHDYGANDGGGDYPYRLQSKKYFMNFFGLTETASGNADKPGVYQSQVIELAGLRTQIILLDTRSFRSSLNKSTMREACPPTGIVPNTAAGATLLGEMQWAWLSRQLNEPADLRIIASSIQIIPTEHCFEKWANFPLERQRLFDLIKEKNTQHLILVSGDRHIAEISRLPTTIIGYPLYEVTASGLNSAMGRLIPVEQNSFRTEDANVRVDNFGTLNIDRTAGKTNLRLQLHDAKGIIRQSLVVPLSSLEYASDS